MIPGSILIDTNLLILFVVGTTSREYITKHKRLAQFTTKDYDSLVEILSRAPSVLLTPNTLTETSNLIAHIGEPAKGHVFRKFQEIIAQCDEQYVTSRTAAGRAEFLRLGLTDAALLEASTPHVAIVTTDLKLYLAAWAKGTPAINFNHIMDQNM